MFQPFFENLRNAGLPVSLREYLTFLQALKQGLAMYDVEEFYYLARTSMVKDERNIDKFDRAFAASFKGLEQITAQQVMEAVDIPEEWIRKMAEKHLSPEEMAEIEAMGGFDKLMETLKERLKEQEGRHQGGNKWIGTAGTSPFGAYGYNPEGVRIGQKESRHQRAVKVWDKREFKNLDDTVELGTRNIKVALKRLRRWAREGANEELDLDGTIRSTAENGYLDVKTRPERHNAVKVLLFLDVGETTGVAGMPRSRRMRCCAPMVQTINASLSGTRRCPLMRSPIPAVPMNIGTKRPDRSGCNARATNGRPTCGSTPCPRNIGTIPIPSA
mgnify:CR=1 FL=1